MKSFSKKIIFFENIFRRLVRTKKLRKGKMQLSPESGNIWLPLSDSGEHVWPDPARLLQIRPDQWMDSCRSGRIPAILARFGQISGRIRSDLAGFRLDPASFRLWLDSGQFRPKSGMPASGDFGRMSLDSFAASIPVARCYRILTPLRFRRPTIAGFR